METGKQPYLLVEDLEVIYTSGRKVIHAVNGVSFQVNRHQTLGLVGETGAGKTTIAKAILQILPEPPAKLRKGRIVLDNENLLEKSKNEMLDIRGKKVAMIFQDPMTALNPIQTVGDQIAEGVLLHNHCTRAEAAKRAEEMLEMVGIPGSRYAEYPFEFSGGMKQRVVIAMALACNPELLLADEPTTALDVTIQAQILDLLREIQKKLGTATVFVTHDLGVVARIADRVAVMYAGKIVEIGTVDEIFYDPRHPYTWGLLRSIPAFSRGKESLPSIPGMPPSLLHPPKGDAFASRNAYALEIDFEEEPPMFRVTDSHYAATWLLDERAPKVVPPIGGNTDGT